MGMKTYGCEVGCVALVDTLIRANDKVPKEIRIPNHSSDRMCVYLQNTWPRHLVVCAEHYEGYFSIDVEHNFKEIRQLLSEKGGAQQAEDKQEQIDECEDVEQLACPICISNKKKVALMPCGHCVCFGCSKSMLERTEQKTCPVCREPYSICQRIYL